MDNEPVEINQTELTTKPKLKMKKIISMAALLLASLPATHAQTIADWTFDNYTAASGTVVLNPSAASGVDVATATATTLGFTTALTTPASTAAPDIINSVTGSSTPASPNTWRIRGTPSTANGWTAAAGIGTQGAAFTASTAGYSDIQLTFDVAPTAKGSAYLQVEYTTDYTASTVIWNNATLTYAANPGLVLNNSTAASGGNGIVVGSYLNMVGAAQFYNGVTADLSGVSGVNNDPNFAIEIVNAATGTADVGANNAVLGNSGNWSLDNIQIQVVPEPSSMALTCGGLAALIGFRRLKNRQA
jgi:hypothetical protein